MAFNQPNNQVGQNQPMQSSSNQDVSSHKKDSLSPWDEELPEETPKDRKVGGFSNLGTQSSIKEESSFVIPSNIENQTALNMVDGNNLITHDSDPVSDISASGDTDSIRNGSKDLDIIDDTSSVTNMDNSQTTSSLPGANNIQTSPLPQSVVSTSTAPSIPNMTSGNNVASVAAGNTSMPSVSATPADDIDIFDNSFSAQKAISSDIKPTVSPAQANQTVSPVSAPLPPVSSPSQVSSNPSIASTSFSGASSVVQQPVTTPANLQPQATTVTSQPTTQPVNPVPEARVVSQVAAPPQALASKKNIFSSLFNRSADKKLNNQAAITIPNPVSTSPDQMLDQTMFKKRLPLPLLIIGGAFSLIFLFILLTENGIVSIGFEKLYNPLGLEILWKGLPKDAERAMGQTLSVMKNKTSFKVTGDIRINIDKTVQSPITTPLVSYDKNKYLATYVKPEKAILATTEEEWVVVDPDTDSTPTDTSDQTTSDNSTDLEGNAGESNTSSDSSDTSSDITDTGDSSTGGDQQLSSSYTGAQTTSKELSATVEGFLGKSGNNIKLLVDKAGTSEISLKNSLGKLWVKSDKVKFSSSAEDGKWLEYNLAGLEETDIFESFWAGDWSQSSIKGKKVGNEKIGKVRCYNYQIDDVEIGDALSGIGLTAESVQSVSGHIWVGIKDKLIRKIDLKIMPATAISVTSIELSLKFDNFGQNSEFSKPDSLEIITDPAPFTSDEESIDEENSGSDGNTQNTESAEAKAAAEKAAAEALIAKNDAQRKADLMTMKNALESYKSKYGKYPLSKSSINLSVESNVVASALIPNYISALPKDPRNSEGWFYGYKSLDGKTYYLSTKLENTLDSSLKFVDGIGLYFLYNN